MIGTEGQYIFKFAIGEYDDFIYEGNIDSFLLIEEAGNVLPTFQLIFRSNQKKMARYFNEGNAVRVQYGKKEPDILINLVIKKVKFVRLGESWRRWAITGFLNAGGYLSNSNLRILSSKSSIQAIQTVTSNYFKNDFNISSSSDSMNWIQPNTTDKKFVNDIWLHSYIPSSYLLLGITSEGDFLCKDMKTLVQNYKTQGYSWRFTNTVTKNNDIPYLGDYEGETRTGLLNQFAGYGKKKNEYDLEDGTSQELTSQALKFLISSNYVDRSGSIASKYTGVMPTSDNVHSNYQAAILNNLANLAILSSLKMTLTYTNTFQNTRILDLVMFKDDDVGKGASIQSSELTTGLYVITKVVRQLYKRKFSTSIEMCREGFNELSSETEGALR